MAVVTDQGGWMRADNCSGYNSPEVRRSPLSCKRANCAIEVRDSSCPAGPVLHFTIEEWVAFCQGARDGEFNEL